MGKRRYGLLVGLGVTIGGAVVLGLRALRNRPLVPLPIEELVVDVTAESVGDSPTLGDCLEEAPVTNTWENPEPVVVGGVVQPVSTKAKVKRVRLGRTGPAIRALVDIGKGLFPNPVYTPEMLQVVSLRLNAVLQDAKFGYNVRHQDRRRLVARASALVFVPDHDDLTQAAILASKTRERLDEELAEYRGYLTRGLMRRLLGRFVL